MVVVIGVGFLVNDVIGFMIVDVGGGIMEIVVFLFGGIVYFRFVCVGGDKMDEVIVSYIWCMYNLLIGEVSVECIKKEVGFVCFF